MFGKLTPNVCGGDRMARRQLHQLDTPVGEERAVGDKQATPAQ
jgi:hypothetical protein